MSGDWAVIEPMEGEECISDICLLAKKEKVPSGYSVVRRVRRNERGTSGMQLSAFRCTDRADGGWKEGRLS